MNRGTEIVEEIKVEMIENDISISDSEGLKLMTDPNMWIESALFFYNNPEMIGVVYAVIDDYTNGFHQHLNIVWLVEEIEILVFVIYFRYFCTKTT